MLETVLRNLYAALAENPKISSLKYVEPLRKSLPGTYVGSISCEGFLRRSIIFSDDVLTNVCMQMHLNILLELHETADVSQAFQHFSSWINEGVDELTFIKSLTKTVCPLLRLACW